MPPRRRPAPPPVERPAQLELFPTAIHVQAVDPRTVLGAGSRVRAIYRVRYGTEPRAHRVFHDRHGWYCEEHGRDCRAVEEVRP